MSAAPVAQVLQPEETAAEDASSEWQNEALYFSGNPYVEQIVLLGEGFTLYGVKVGDKFTPALKTPKKKHLPLQSGQADLYTYRVPALAHALSVDDEGFCGYLDVVVAADGTIQAMRLYSDTVEQPYTGYEGRGL